MSEYLIMIYPAFLLIVYTILVVKRINRGYRPMSKEERARIDKKNVRLAALRKRWIEEGKLIDYTKKD
jgi:hypothetical protein